MTTAGLRRPPLPWNRLRNIGLPGLVALLLVGTGAIRLWAGAGEPLWIDEAWTGVHALQPTFGQFLREVYVDINAPLYYVLTWSWAALFGVSNEALRAPALAFGLLAPLVALLPVREIDRPTRLIWCALLATWPPSLLQAQEARCYTLLFGLATLGVVLHVRMLAVPTLARAAAWAGVGSLAILTHYYAAILFGCQGLAYLARHRAAAVRTWPAALLYLPAFGWMAYHLPQLAGFAQTNWYTRLDLAALPLVGFYVVGPAPLTLALMGAGLRGSIFGLSRDVFGGRGAALAWAVAAVAAATLVLVTAGMLRPSFTARYLTIFVPGLLLAVSAWAAAIARQRPWAPAVLLAAAFGWALLWTVNVGAGPSRILNFEAASAHLVHEGADTVAFTWDNPSARGLEPRQMAEFGSFFFRRAAAPVTTIGLSIPADGDPNRLLPDAARGRKPGILWVYDLNVPGTAAIAHPAAIERLDPTWACRDFGRDTIGVVACIRSAPKPPPV